MPKFEEGEFEELEEYWDRIVPRNFFAGYANTDGHNNSNTRNGGWIISNGWEKHNYTPNSGWTRSNKDWEGNTIERNSDGGKWSNETENLQHESMTQEREQMDKRKDTKEQTGDKEKSLTGLTAQQKDIKAQITLQLTDIRV